MALSQTFFLFYIILQIVQCHSLGNLEKRFIENQNGVKRSLTSRNLHVFAEKFKPFLYETDTNHTYIGINYLLIKTIGEHLNMGISLDFFTSDENRLENWTPLSKWAAVCFCFFYSKKSRNCTFEFLCCRADIAAVGKFTNFHHDKQIATSIPYYQDELIWCIQHAKKYPIFINFFFIIPLEIWVFIIGVGFIVVSVLIYLLLPFDENYEHRIENFDMFYCFLCVVIPAVTAVSCPYNPKKFIFRFTYWLLVVCPMFFHMFIGAFLYNFMNYQFYLYQISSVNEILDAEFRLTGSMEVLNVIKQDSMVRYEGSFILINKILILIYNFHSIQRDRLKTFMYAIILTHAWNI